MNLNETSMDLDGAGPTSMDLDGAGQTSINLDGASKTSMDLDDAGETSMKYWWRRANLDEPRWTSMTRRWTPMGLDGAAQTSMDLDGAAQTSTDLDGANETSLKCPIDVSSRSIEVLSRFYRGFIEVSSRFALRHRGP